jgi:RNA polymerase sigma factor (sigma-70 family)
MQTTPTTRVHPVFRDLRLAALLGAGAQISDGQLLEDFVVRRDEAAFAVLVRRHGPLVLGVCLRVIGNTHDAEDAFQATFLVLARKAGTVQQREAVGNWLYGVAYRTALRARAVAARRRQREKQVKNMPEPIVEAETDRLRELEPVLDAELSRLPDKYRIPLVLCDLEGGSPKQVARRLKLAEGTVGSRLTRARQMLAHRLRRRGFTISGVALASVVGGKSALASVAPPLVSSTVKAAITVAAGSAAASSVVSAKVAALTEGVLKAMLLTKLKIAMGMLLATSVLVFGVATLSLRSLATAQTNPGKPTNRQPAAKGGTPAKDPTRWKERLTMEAPDDRTGSFSIAISPDGKRVAVSWAGGGKVLDATTGRELATLPGVQPTPALAFSPDGNLIARGQNSGSDLLLCSADSGEVKATLKGSAKNDAVPMGGQNEPRKLVGAFSVVRSVAFSPDGKTLAVATGGTVGGVVHLWDLDSKKVLREFNKLPPEGESGEKEARAWSIAFSPDGKKLATAQGSDRTAKVWDVATGKELATFGKHPNWVIGVAFSPDGKTLASASAGKDPQVKLWDLTTGKERFTLKGAASAVSSLAFSADGKILANVERKKAADGDEKAVVQLWDPATGKEIVALDMHGGPALEGVSLGFSQNGILAAVSDATICVWEPENGPATKKK